MSEGRFFHIAPSRGIQRLASFEEAIASLQGGGYIWLDYFDPDKEALAPLIAALGIHPLSVEDCLDENQIPKIEDFPGHTFLLFNRFTYADRASQVEEVDLMLGKNFLVSVSGHGGTGRGPFEKVEEMAALDIANVEKGPDYLLHVILDYTVDGKFAAIGALEEEIEAAEEAMLSDVSTFSLGDLVGMRRALLAFRKSLFHEREILIKICRKDCPFITEQAIYHFRDIYDHLAKFFELTEMNRDILTSLTEMYLSLINNRMAHVANRTNKTVRRLTLITTIFMPLSLLAGIGGMSEWSMMTGPENWKIAYPAFLAGMVVIGLINWWLLNWFESRDRKRHKKRA